MAVKNMVDTTLIIAVYGAVLSTISIVISVILAIRELRKEKKRLRIFLDWVAWVERAEITLVNVGHRPVTVMEIGMSVFYGEHDGQRHYDPVPANSLLWEELKNEPLPVTLKDGEQVTIPLGSTVSSLLRRGGMDAQLNIYDAEGNVYDQYETREFDAKWNRYTKTH